MLINPHEMRLGWRGGRLAVKARDGDGCCCRGSETHLCPSIVFSLFFFPFLKIFGVSKGNGVSFLKGLLGVEKEE